jgi:hypothetical protein
MIDSVRRPTPGSVVTDNYRDYPSIFPHDTGTLLRTGYQFTREATFHPHKE